MIPAIRGRLITSTFAARLTGLRGVSVPDESACRALSRWAEECEAHLGPASSLRAVCDCAALPLIQMLGYTVEQRRDAVALSRIATGVDGRTGPVVLAVTWGTPLETVWRTAILSGIATDVRWCFCTNGLVWRIVDGHRTWSRRYLEFDIATLARNEDTRKLFWILTGVAATTGPEPLLDRAVELSAREGAAVCRALGDGVLDALGTIVGTLSSSVPRRQPTTALARTFEQSLTILYRILFLLFAEARGLVPVWHPIYRDRYTVEAIVTTLMAQRPYRGLWQAVQAISSLAHAGCRAGELRVTAFNGRLFSPQHTPLAESARMDDDTMGRVVLAVSTSRDPAGGGHVRIAYGDLDVEQLGAVYEHVLDYEPRRDTQSRDVGLRRTGDVRKASSTFYTPRSVTDYLVRTTLAPLVRDRSADEILALRVLDPAMGSGAFLVSACRYLAGAAETALIRTGEWHAGDVTASDRAQLRRDVAQRCLFGVDLNPMAVQLARLSLWLATLSAERPLSFLDHHLASGDSVIGAAMHDLLRQPPSYQHLSRPTVLPLFDHDALESELRHVVSTRLELTVERDDDARIVRRKELKLAALKDRRLPISKWKSALDLWCACWFWDDGVPPPATVFGELLDGVFQRHGVLPPHVSRRWADRIGTIAERRRFLHWTLEFPEVFFDSEGRPRPNAGFDAIVGNPPWDMIRGDSGEGALRGERREDARQLTRFVRDSGIYQVELRAHPNRYQLFLERALQLAKHGGRIGLVLPGGLATDTGAAPLRRHLFDRAAVDTIVGLDNRAGIFPIHRSVRFILLTASTGQPTTRIACRFGIADAAQLDAIGDDACSTLSFPLTLTPEFLSRVSGKDDVGVPELLSVSDFRILEKITATHPCLGANNGWNVRFGRELNATDDRGAFVALTGSEGTRPVLEGKQIEPFRVSLQGCRHELRADAAARTKIPRRARLAYRDVASATNRLTLIAAIIPARAVTTHTLFCLRTLLSYERQLALCALLNSFVANYLIRLRVSTHVTAALMSQLAIPVLEDTEPTFARLVTLTRRLMSSTASVESCEEYVELQALVAKLYDLTRDEFAHILDSFPLIARETRDRALSRFSACCKQ
jgi:hypothetical protein